MDDVNGQECLFKMDSAIGLNLFYCNPAEEESLLILRENVTITTGDR